MERPLFIRHYLELLDAVPGTYPRSDEPLALRARLGQSLGLGRLAIHLDTLAPGRRTSYPHAERVEEEFVYVVEGTPDVWIDGYLHRLRAGDACAFPPGTGICHSFINNSTCDVRLLVVGEPSRPDNQWWYPLHPEQSAEAGPGWWTAAPQRALGPHDGLPDARRGHASPDTTHATTRPDFIRHFLELQDPDNSHYPGSDELLSFGSPLGRKLGLQRLGIHHEHLPPGRRSSWPHAESAEEEFFFVLEGEPDVWIDGYLHRMREGEACAFAAGTGISHCVINNTRQPVRLFVVGESGVPNSKIFYPLHPQRRAQIPDHWWGDSPARSLGPHRGEPDPHP
jgi:uncharacterized cupin superfamily protein